jgi:tRNA (Thr-GGU) A37 N-methylase
MKKIEVGAIGIIKNKFDESADPFEIKKEVSEIIINEEYEDGLFKLEESEYIDVLFHFHLSESYKLFTNIYTGEKKGVFASRSPKKTQHHWKYYL